MLLRQGMKLVYRREHVGFKLCGRISGNLFLQVAACTSVMLFATAGLQQAAPQLAAPPLDFLLPFSQVLSAAQVLLLCDPMT